MSKTKPAPKGKKSVASEKDKQAKELELQKDADRLVHNEVHHVLSALTEKCLAEGIFSYDDITNYYHYRVGNKIKGFEDYMTEEQLGKYKVEVQEKMDELNNEFAESEEQEASEQEQFDAELSNWTSHLRELENLESQPQEIFEWWIVSDWLMEKLEERGEPILKADDYWLNLWGRTNSGQSISMDSSIRAITRETYSAECGGEMNLEKGGKVYAGKWKVEIPFGMRIKESNNEAEYFDSKTTYTVDADTEEQAEEKAISKFYDDPAYGDENYQIEIKGVFAEQAVMEKGGLTLNKEMLNDFAWDIGIQNKWIVGDKWVDDASKSKAFDLAKHELSHYDKGGKTGGFLDGIDWIITGKS